jgi:hypothetical protein
MIESGRRDPQKLPVFARSATTDTRPSADLPAEALAEAGGVPGSTRTSTGRALNAFPLPLGYRHIEDQAGFEPAMGLSQRIKSPPRSAATVTGPWRTRVVTIHMPTG